MSDYMFMLESHLSSDQFRAVGQMQALSSAAGVSLYLTGAAIRDMLAGFPVRDLQFTVEGSAAKLAKTAVQKLGAKEVSTDDLRKSVVLNFPGGVHVEIATSKTEKYAKSAGKPQIAPAPIYDDLRCRDFTINAIALSLNKASLGLLVDPTNGIGDIERKELRATHNYLFYDDPARMLRLVRYRVRMSYAIDERTKMQFENAREAGMLEKISPEAMAAELRAMAGETNSHDLIKLLDEEQLLGLYSPMLAGSKINYGDLMKLQKARQGVPFSAAFKMDALALFLTVVLEPLNAKDRAAFFKASGLTKGEAASLAKLTTGAKKLERDLKGAKLVKPSQLYQAILKAPGEQVLYLLVYSGQRLVTDRIKNYFAKYLPMALEVTDDMVTAVAPDSPKFAKAKWDLTLKTLDARPKKPAPLPEPPPPPPSSGFGRGPSVRSARLS